MNDKVTLQKLLLKELGLKLGALHEDFCVMLCDISLIRRSLTSILCSLQLEALISSYFSVGVFP